MNKDWAIQKGERSGGAVEKGDPPERDFQSISGGRKKSSLQQGGGLTKCENPKEGQHPSRDANRE